jgi:hypothetical protein
MNCTSELHSLCTRFLKSKQKTGEEVLDTLENTASDFIRTKVVIPYCKKYGYTFTAGMGSWVFVNAQGKTCHPYEDFLYSDTKPTEHIEDWHQEFDGEWVRTPTAEDKAVHDILCFQYSWSKCCIGAYMKDVQADDLREHPYSPAPTAPKETP